jgi:hypothetical protein
MANRKIWTADQVKQLGVVIDITTAGEILGMGRSGAYVLLYEGRFPVPTFKVGRRTLVPTAPLLKLLGLADDDDDRPGPPTLRAV